MKRFAFCAAVLASAALALSACATTGGGGSVPATVASADMTVEKSLLTAEASFDAVSLIAKSAADSGVLRGAKAAAALAALDKAHDALVLARSAYVLGDMAAVSLSIATATANLSAARAAVSSP